MSDLAHGSCLCGAVRFELELPARFVCHCHCTRCRRAHGAAFVTWAGFEEARVRLVAGEERLVRYVTDTGATRSFCGTCGSTLFYESPRWAGELHVALGNVDGGVEQLPDRHVSVDHGAEWCAITDDLPQFGGESGMESKV